MSEFNETPETNRDDVEAVRPAECSTNTAQMPIYNGHVKDDADVTPVPDANTDTGAEATEILGTTAIPDASGNPSAVESFDATEIIEKSEGSDTAETVQLSSALDKAASVEATAVIVSSESIDSAESADASENIDSRETGAEREPDNSGAGANAAGSDVETEYITESAFDAMDASTVAFDGVGEANRAAESNSTAEPNGAVKSNETEGDAAEQTDADEPTSATAQGDQPASTSVPLYATEPPRGYGYQQTGANQQHGAKPQAFWNPQHSQHPQQPYVQVPRESQPVAPLMVKTGPSVATIVFGTLGLVLGAITAAFGLFFPMTAVVDPVVNFRVAIAALCAILGGILIVVALIWALVSWLRRGNRRLDAEDVDTEQAAK
ncbi:MULTISPECIES: hypothetical protein [Bifidobacterium]|jgi:hypothetical protein|uniref:Uncharacterized protein n=1 Tax=Bifidobacterium tibiigranuli TaxID=2172043 RepID=A0A5N6S0N0_9BIFI|nr:hypothetical protein [Bifidobacterium tibiigranuli]KAE8127003.1 hypothetical protein DDF78_09350 [Bifidobacterium tibiigranuli]KAE8127799.1 hypothetical protein DDE84_07785 [Bifidobacterium tibiigranuli]MCH3973933.1 hypothetical protein [Bifidobacterium tibiigranuli]MCH4190346.1 hypothetical protein [Bifidobacterium tibiigranuli]MCH4203927.1 hypothetical protein [Bifidobacterium tibiigranuli]